MKDKKAYLEFCAQYVRDFKSQKTGREYKVFQTTAQHTVYVPREYAEGPYEVGDTAVLVAEIFVKEGVGFFVYHTRY